MAFFKRIIQSGAELLTSPLRDEETFLAACLEGDEKTLERQLTYNVNVNCGRHDKGQTGVILAASGGHVAVYKRLIECGAKVETTDHSGNTALHFAARIHHAELCSLLLEHGAPLDAKGYELCTALHVVINNIEEEQLHDELTSELASTLDVFVQHGADLNSTNYKGLTPLHIAAYKGSTSVCSLLFEHGSPIDIETQCKEKFTPLHIAAEQGHAKLCNWLLLNGADIAGKTFHGNTALHCVVYNKDNAFSSSVCDALKNHGTDIEAKDNSGRTPLSLAVQECNDDGVKWLLENGANVNDAYCFFDIYAKREKMEICEILLKNYVIDINKTDSNGLTMLHAYAKECAYQVCKMLIDNGADLDAVTHIDHHTPLHVATQSGSESVVRLLLPYGAQTNAKTTAGLTALYYAAKHGCEGSCRELVRKGADTHFREPNSNRTLAQVASSFDTRRYFNDIKNKMSMDGALCLMHVSRDVRWTTPEARSCSSAECPTCTSNTAPPACTNNTASAPPDYAVISTTTPSAPHIDIDLRIPSSFADHKDVEPSAPAHEEDSLPPAYADICQGACAAEPSETHSSLQPPTQSDFLPNMGACAAEPSETHSSVQPPTQSDFLPNMPVPYQTTIKGGIWPGTTCNRIVIEGMSLEKPHRFHINIGYDYEMERDIAFRFDVRFDEQEVVRNTKDKRSLWGYEERAGGFPFLAAKFFQIVVICSHDKYKVLVNDVDFIEYSHRLMNLEFMPKAYLYIDGDVLLSRVNIQ